VLKVPGRKAIRTCIASLDAFEVAVAQHGPEEAMKRFRPVGRGLEVARPLERVEIDEWRIDLMSILAGSGLLALFTPEELVALGLDGSIARWSIVVAIDCRTRVILGMILTPDPRASAAIACLRMITSDKGEISDATGAAVRWSQFGTPELLASDNGAAFKAAEFTTACNDLGITHERTIAGAPSMRATIERFFRTCAIGLLPRLSGRTFSDVVERARHPAEARACLEPGDLCFSLVRWIVDIYHNTPHEGLGGRTPLAQWEADHRDGNYPLRAAPDRRKKRLAFGIGLQRTVSREGVVFHGIRYHSEALAVFHQRRGGRTVDLRVDPADLGIVEVCIDGAWQEVPAVHEGFDGLPIPVWRAARRNLQTSSSRRAEWEEAVVVDAIQAIKGLNQHRTLAFGLIDKGYTREQLDGLERSLSAGSGLPPRSRNCATKAAAAAGPSCPSRRSRPTRPRHRRRHRRHAAGRPPAEEATFDRHARWPAGCRRSARAAAPDSAVGLRGVKVTDPPPSIRARWRSRSTHGRATCRRGAGPSRADLLLGIARAPILNMERARMAGTVTLPQRGRIRSEGRTPAVRRGAARLASACRKQSFVACICTAARYVSPAISLRIGVARAEWRRSSGGRRA
jgi:putative transposase